jgi:hypothetical protein
MRFGYSYSRDTRFSTYDLSSICSISVLLLILTIQNAYDGGNESSKPVSTIIFKGYKTCNHCFPPRRVFLLLLCWVTTFYLCAPLREHSCHSEYNVHYPKVFIDWFILLVSLVLKLCVSSRPLKLEGVLCIYILLSIKDKLKTVCMFFLMIWTYVWLLLFHFHDLLFVFIFMFITWLLSFFYQDYVFHAHVLSSFDHISQRLHIWSRLCRCMTPQKLFLLLSLTYSRTSRS